MKYIPHTSVNSAQDMDDVRDVMDSFRMCGWGSIGRSVSKIGYLNFIWPLDPDIPTVIVAVKVIVNVEIRGMN